MIAACGECDQQQVHAVEDGRIGWFAMKGMVEREDIADRIGRRKTDGRRTDDRRVHERDCKECARPVADILGDAGRDGAGILKGAELVVSGECCGCDRHHRKCPDDDDDDADDEIPPFVVDETRRDAFVDDVALLEKQLPRCDGRSDDSRNQQHHRAEFGAFGKTGDDEIMDGLSERNVDGDEHGNEQKAADAEHKTKSFETTEAALDCTGHDESGGNCDAPDFGQTEEVQRQADADEFGYDREGIEDEEIDDAERAPEFAEAFENEARVSDAADGAESQDHLLVDEEHGDEEQQRPQKRGSVVLSRLRVRTERTGVVVADHDDEAGPENC